MSDVEKFEWSTILPLKFKDREEELRTLLFMQLCRENHPRIGQIIEIITKDTDSMDVAAIASVVWLNAVAMRIMEMFAEKLEDPKTGGYRIAPRPEVVDELVKYAQTSEKEKFLEGILKAMMTMFTIENARAVIVSFLEGNRNFANDESLVFNVPMPPHHARANSNELIEEISREARKKAEATHEDDIQYLLKQTGTH